MKHPIARKWSLLLAGLLPVVLLITPTAALSDIPPVISYTGHLSDSGGNPVDVTVNLTFKLYKDSNGNGQCDGHPSCTAFWTETHSNVEVNNGIFGVGLGLVTGFGNIGFKNPYLLGIEVNTDGEMSPLLRMTSAPYALRAEVTKGSAVTVNCPADSIQSALNGGATQITINGFCNEAVTIGRNGVTLQAGTNNTTDGIDWNDVGATGASALKIFGANKVFIKNLGIKCNNSPNTWECVTIMASASAFFEGIAVSNYADTGVMVGLNSSAEFDSGSSITGGEVGVDIWGSSDVEFFGGITISGFSEEGIYVGENSVAYIGDDDLTVDNWPGDADVTITGTASGGEGIVGVEVDESSSVEINSTYIYIDGTGASWAQAVWVGGNSSVFVENSRIITNAYVGMWISGNGSLVIPNWNNNTYTQVKGPEAGIKLNSGSVEIGAGTVEATAAGGSGIEVYNNAEISISDDAVVNGNSSGTTYGLECHSGAVLSTWNSPTITGNTAAILNNSGNCNLP